LLTSNQSSDDILAQVVKNAGFTVFRGSKDNVLERFYKCANALSLDNNDIIVRLTGDCPVHDATVIDELIATFMATEMDYMANCIVPLYPDGLDVEVFTFSTLEQSHLEASKLSEQEHVTPYIRDSGLFNISDLEKKIIHNNWRLTVDELRDFIVIEKIYNHFKSNSFTFEEMILFLEENLDILEINSNINRNEGYTKSVLEDDNARG